MFSFANGFEISDKDAQIIAKKVWQNEGMGLDKYLIHWNKGENFASLGIGHFIWFYKGDKERFREVFPMFLEYLERKNIKLPNGLTSKSKLPWTSRKEFYKAKKSKSKEYQKIFNLLKKTKIYQAKFMAKRVERALDEILKTINSNTKRELISQRFNNLLYKNNKIDPQGLYILIDYTNFKGEGTLKSERYKGEGWGLLQVLENINPKIKNRYKAFALSAKYVLKRRVKNSPPKRGEKRWTRGWNKRLDGYTKK